MPRPIILVAALVTLALTACPKGPPKPTKEEIAKGTHLEKPFNPPGRCFGKPTKCVSDAQCAPPFVLCQEGACCSGELDPATCTCRCGQGPACRPREVCCSDPAAAHTATRTAGVRCRSVRECYGGE